jgi:hypothetical protein
MDLHETFIVIPSYRGGNRQPLIDLLKVHKDNGKPLSQAILDLLIEIAQKANLRKRGKPANPATKSRAWEVKEAVRALLCEDPTTPMKNIISLVAESVGLSTKSVEKIVYPKKKSSPQSR